jgi:DNA-binding NtrC family response regulator
MHTIILQDTDHAILDLLTQALGMEGFAVKPVTGLEGNLLNLIASCRPKVVVLDYRLNGEVCRQHCKEIKERYPHVPVIAMSCNDGIGRIARQYHFDGYIRKPFDLDLVFGIIRRQIKKSDSS